MLEEATVLGNGERLIRVKENDKEIMIKTVKRRKDSICKVSTFCTREIICPICDGSGCKICNSTGYYEITDEILRSPTSTYHTIHP